MSADIFVPQSSAADALVSSLHTITYTTADAKGLRRALIDGFDLVVTDRLQPARDEFAALNSYFGFAEKTEWHATCYGRRDAAHNVQLRVIEVDESVPMVRPSIDGSYLGGASIGFPMHAMKAREKTVAKAGIQSSIGVKEMEFTGPTGEVYISAEIHFLGPENIFLLGVRRPDVFVPVGPMHGATNIGGPAYSARCVTHTETVIDFFVSVLGYETRRDVTLTVGDRSGLRLEAGSPERFVQLFAPGAATGYVVLLDHEDATKPTPAPTEGPASRGMGMWSFATTNLDLVHTKARAANCTVLAPPAPHGSPFICSKRSMVIRDPGGFPIEVFGD